MAHSDEGHSELGLAMAALEEKVGRLESWRVAQEAARSRQRRRWSASLMIALVPLVAVVVGGSVRRVQEQVTPAMFIDSAGNVGIGTTSPTAMLDVRGRLSVTDSATLAAAQVLGVLQAAELEVLGPARFRRTVNVTERTTLADANVGGVLEAAVLEVLGPARFKRTVEVTERTTLADARVEGVLEAARMEVSGNARFTGTVTSVGRYQRNDEVEATYEVSPRYHMSLTAASYEGRTKTIPHDVIESLCGDSDGCEYRLGMDRWSRNTDPVASRVGVLYYSGDTGRWRTNTGSGENSGVDGDGAVQHIRDAWSTCYFTDGTYRGHYRDAQRAPQERSDSARGLQLLVWRTSPYTNVNRTCELTIID